MAASEKGVFVSVDTGATWDDFNNGLWDKDVLTITTINTYYIGTRNGYVFVYKNALSSWEPSNYGWTNDPVTALWALSGDVAWLYAGTAQSILFSSDSGKSWSGRNGDLGAPNVIGFAINEGGLFVGTLQGLFRSQDNGGSWTLADSGLYNLSFSAIASDGLRSLYAATFGGGLYSSTNFGKSWNAIGGSIANRTISQLQVQRNFTLRGSTISIDAATDSGMFISSDNGADWTVSNTGLTDVNLTCFTFLDGRIIVGTDSGDIFYRPVPEVVLGAPVQKHSVPARFHLHQNYPNPFNPTTKITYELPEQSHVTLRLYDALGREISTLVDRIETAGVKTINLDATSLSSGMYMCTLRAGAFADSKKIVVLK
ncbi:MAG TPA: T9SS type A sorting domain-containing protein [Bacteroidota bacterium]|nr:T9SS type A sorting domain-containing protein [Bacteroidota bacterium]